MPDSARDLVSRPLPPPADGDPDVVVVGAGPAGLLLGLLLGRRGRRVLLVERAPEPRPGAGNGICPILQPVTLGVLDGLGLLPALRKDAAPLTRGEVVAGGRPVAAYSYGDLPGAPVDHALAVSILHLRDVLTEAVRATDGVEIVYEATVHGLPARAGAAPGTRDVRVETAAGVRTLRPSLVVGCDGKHSAVRDMAGIAASSRTYLHGYLELRVPLPEFWGPSMRAYFTPDGYLLGTPIAGGQLLIVWITAPEVAERALAGPLADLTERFAAGVPDAADWIRAHTRDRSQFREFAHHIVRPERWSDGNVLLVGDSAHGVHVYGGQGLNLSLQDAACLAEACDEALGAGTTTALHQFEEVRRPYISAFQDMQETHLEALADAVTAGPHRPQGDGERHLPEFAPLALGQPELRARLSRAAGVPHRPAEARA